MQQRKSFVGPRGWAMLTLVGGFTLAAPFFRPPDVDVEGAVKQPPNSHSTGLARLASMEFQAADPVGPTWDASDRSSFGLPDLSRQILAPASSSPTELPAWAPVRSPIDQLISQGTAPAWHSGAERESTLKPLRPWINQAGAGPLQTATSPAPSPATIAARAWPDPGTLPSEADRRSEYSDRRLDHSHSATAASDGNMVAAGDGAAGSLGNLTSTAQTMRASTTPRLRPPEPSTAPPPRRQFVYQPGFKASTTSP